MAIKDPNIAVKLQAIELQRTHGHGITVSSIEIHHHTERSKPLLHPFTPQLASIPFACSAMTTATNLNSRSTAATQAIQGTAATTIQATLRAIGLAGTAHQREAPTRAPERRTDVNDHTEPRARLFLFRDLYAVRWTPQADLTRAPHAGRRIRALAMVCK
jgi:hypothetical protein